MALTEDELDRESREIVAVAESDGLALRTVGGVGIWQRLGAADRERYREVRPTPRDIDLLAPSGTSPAIKRVFAARDYTPDERLIAWRGDRRHRYFRLHEGEPVLEIDVFLGVPPLCHPIDFGDRFGLPGPAMAPTDLLLQKLQIVESNAKDLVDLCFLLAAHGLGDDERQIVPARVADLLSRDWGFHHTTEQNLEKAEGVADEVLDADHARRAREGIAGLRQAIDAAPKTRRWKLRARVGTRAQWYEEVEEVDR
jgi:hypothetical protein